MKIKAQSKMWGHLYDNYASQSVRLSLMHETIPDTHTFCSLCSNQRDLAEGGTNAEQIIIIKYIFLGKLEGFTPYSSFELFFQEFRCEATQN